MELFTTQYDRAITDLLPHLQNYPEMKPFIGKYWDSSSYKILLLGESHYMPKDELIAEFKDKNYVTDWYNNSSKGFYNGLSCYINTRDVLNQAEKVKELRYSKTLSIYYNLKSALKKNYSELATESYIFPFFSYYNYFQRPAFQLKESIDNNKTDNVIAYNSLKTITNIINPAKIIFCSRKAFGAFKLELQKDTKCKIFNNVIIDNVPHPSCAWWYRKSNACGGRSGLEKFTDIIKQ